MAIGPGAMSHAPWARRQRSSAPDPDGCCQGCQDAVTAIAWNLPDLSTYQPSASQ